MGITMWYASGVMGKGSGHNPYGDDQPPTRGEKWTMALFVLVFLIGPIIAAIVILWATVMAPPQDTSWCAQWVGGHCAERAR